MARTWIQVWLVAFAVSSVACGDRGAPRVEADADESAPANDHATVTLGDRTWTFSDFSCLVIAREEFVNAVPQVSDDGEVKLSATHETNGRSMVTVKDVEGAFQYSAGNLPPAPAVTIEGRTVTFEGTFINDFDTTERTDGSVTLQC